MTNKVDGVWTGVSLARHERLVYLLREGSDVGHTLSLNLLLFLRFVWNQAASPECLVDFLLVGGTVYELSPEHMLLNVRTYVHHLFGFHQALDSHRQVLVSKEDTAYLANERFTRQELTDDSAVIRAVENIAARAGARVAAGMGRDIELLAANVSSAHAFKPAHKQRRIRSEFDQDNDIPDCVEVVIREIIDQVLWDSRLLTLDMNRLPPECSPALRHFYDREVGEVQDDTSQRAAEFFDLCQNLPGCAYLRSTLDGRDYELVPSLENLARVLGCACVHVCVCARAHAHVCCTKYSHPSTDLRLCTCVCTHHTQMFAGGKGGDGRRMDRTDSVKLSQGGLWPAS